jgi:hypothetical protein
MDRAGRDQACSKKGEYDQQGHADTQIFSAGPVGCLLFVFLEHGIFLSRQHLLRCYFVFWLIVIMGSIMQSPVSL